MLQRMLIILGAVTLFGVSPSLQASVDAQGFVGQRKARHSSARGGDEMLGKEYGLALHYHPMAGVPLGIGAFAAITDYAVGAENIVPMDQLTSQESGVDLRVVLPVDALGIKVVSRLGYTIWGEYKGSLNSAQKFGGPENELIYKMRSRGIHISAGVSYSPVLLMSVVLMLDYSRQKLDVTDLDVYDLESGTYSLDNMPSDIQRLETGSFNHESRAVTLGMELGI